MKQIIVNADDFGINETVTAEIEKQILLGNVSSTTVMANGACLDEVKHFAVQHPEVSFGVHLCLSEFDSLTKSNSLMHAGLIGEDGVFIHKAVFELKGFISEAVKNAIRDELNAQIDVVTALGFTISHADSHHHVHTIYPLKEVFADVLRRRGINRVRLGSDFRTIRMKLHARKWLQRNNLNKYYKRLFTTTDGFYSYAEFVEAGCPMNNREIIELMCHPGHLGLDYRNEIDLVEKNIIPREIKLITYNDIY